MVSTKKTMFATCMINSRSWKKRNDARRESKKQFLLPNPGLIPSYEGGRNSTVKVMMVTRTGIPVA